MSNSCLNVRQKILCVGAYYSDLFYRRHRPNESGFGENDNDNDGYEKPLGLDEIEYENPDGIGSTGPLYEKINSPTADSTQAGARSNASHEENSQSENGDNSALHAQVDERNEENDTTQQTSGKLLI